MHLVPSHHICTIYNRLANYARRYRLEVLYPLISWTTVPADVYKTVR